MHHVRLLAAVGLILCLGVAAQAQAAEDDLETMVTAMAKVGASTTASFSPDGERIAFVSNLSGSPQVWLLDSQGGWPQQLTSLDGSVGNASWSPNGSWIAFHYVPPRGGGQQVYVIRPDGTGLRRLTEGGEESNFHDGWSPGSRYLMIASNRLESQSIDAYVYDMERGELELVSATPALDELVRISPDERRGILYRQADRGDNDLVLIDLETHEEHVLTPHTPPGSFGSPHFSPDGTTVYFSSDRDREFSALAQVRIGADGQPGPMEVVADRQNGGLEQFVLAPSGESAAVSWNVAGRSELHLLDMKTLEQGPAIDLPNDIIVQLQISPDSRELAMTVIGSAAPPNIWILDIDSGEFRQLTFSSHPGVDLSKIVRPELVRLEAHDGLEISGWLYRPRGAQGSLPTVVIIHGGPEAQERPTFLGTYQALVQRGIMVFAPNVRGSTGFGKRFAHLDNGALRTDAVRDVKSGIDHLVSQGLADPDRVGVFGFSSGGFLALSAIVRFPETFSAGALLSALVDLEGFFRETEPWMASISKAEYGDPDEDAAILRELSPITEIDDVEVPLLVIHGALDTNVPVGQADRVVESLEERQVPVEYLRFPDERHGVSELPNRIRSSVEVVKWFDEYLKGNAPVPGAAAEQPSTRR